MANPNKNLIDPAYNSSLWNIPLNANFDNIDKGFGGTQVFNLSSYAGGTIAVSSGVYVGAYPANTASYIPLSWYIASIPTGATNLQIPSGVGGRWLVNVPHTLVSGGITISSGGGGASVLLVIPSIYDVYSDGTNIFMVSGSSPGDLKPCAVGIVPSGWLLCYGQSVAISSYPYLYAAIGTYYGGSGASFTVPDLRGRVVAGLDNMGGSAAGRLTSYTSLGFAGGEQSHTLITGEMPSHNHLDNGHTHSDAGHNHAQNAHNHFDPGHVHTDAGHTHGGVVVAGGAYGGSVPPYLPISTGGTTSTGFASIQSSHAGLANATATNQTGYASIQNGFASISNTGGSASHNNVQPTIGVNWLIRY